MCGDEELNGGRVHDELDCLFFFFLKFESSSIDDETDVLRASAAGEISRS